jgi:quercetin dioxygenase-like cupin family protein
VSPGAIELAGAPGRPEDVHHFGGGVYAKQVSIPAGVALAQHAHFYEHLSFLVSGVAEVVAGDVVRVYTGPTALVMPANVHHAVKAVTDVVWLCIHATDVTDLDAIDSTLGEAADLETANRLFAKVL